MSRDAEKLAAILYRPKRRQRRHGRAMHRAIRKAAMRRMIPKIVQFLLELPSRHAEYMDAAFLKMMAEHPLVEMQGRLYVGETLMPEQKK